MKILALLAAAAALATLASTTSTTATQIPARPSPTTEVATPVQARGGLAGKPERCQDARRAIGFYIRSTWRWQRLSHRPRTELRTRGRTCAQARRDVAAIRAESQRARRGYQLWISIPKLAGETWWDVSMDNPVNRNLYRIGSCETGGKPGQNGTPDWDHANSVYGGAFGFRHSTWAGWRIYVRPLPPAQSWRATPAEQYAVGRALVRTFNGYSSWPACHVRLGLG